VGNLAIRHVMLTQRERHACWASLIVAAPGALVTPALANPSAIARRKIARRLLPFLFPIYMTAFIDRVNVGLAGLDRTPELHFSNEVFGAGIFFFGLCRLEIPGFR
jgi:hypothetical protein